LETIRLGIIMNGVTGRMGTNQHLIRSICAIRTQGGVALADGRRVMPDPILIGRNADKLERLAKANGVTRWTTDLGAALANKDDTVYFDSASTGLRPALIKQAIAAGKHIYTEKPVAPTLRRSTSGAAKAAGVTRCRQDKLAARPAQDEDADRFGFFGRILSVRGSSATGYSKALATGTASWELPQGGRRRHHRRHALPLARCSQPVRRSKGGQLYRRHAHSPALGRTRTRIPRNG
jgi:hypothetical protein